MKTKKLLPITLLIFFFSSHYLSCQAQDKIIWADQMTQFIYTANFDGSDITIIHDNQAVVRRLQYSAIDEKIYWVSSADGQIRKSNLDGSALEVVFNSGSTTLNLIELDHSNNRIFYSNSNDGLIRTINIDGTNDQSLISGVGNTVQGLAYDSKNDFIYWTETDNHRIRRANGNGDNPTTILQLGSSSIPFDIELDSTNQKLYFIDRGDNKIHRVDVNGDNLETIITTLGTKTVISLDLFNQKLYWTNGEFQFINSANLDGSDINIIYMGTTQLAGLDVAPTPPLIISTNTPTPANQITLYPNPSSEFLNINLNHNYLGLIHFNIFNANGKLVHQEKIQKSSPSFNQRIDIQQYNSGVYFLQVQLGKETITKRFVHFFKPDRA